MKKLTNIILATGAAVLVISTIFAFNTPAPSYEYQTFTTIESIVPGGLGRSRMLSDNGSGSLDEQKIKNLYSVVGIKMDNIFENDQNVTEKLNELGEEGWELAFVNTGVQSPTDGGSTGIYCTRYILRRVK
ncbi:MAG: hypothetical protein P8L64_01165 [Flavobacteriales bacterium]|jgi:hypothetical protein|nr:hypothetical protein [Flavobacteriales bacterium]